MSGLTLVVSVAATALLIRQLMILRAIVHSGRFLRGPTDDRARVRLPARSSGLRFIIVLPVLREVAVIAEAISHFTMLTKGHAAQLVVVTTEREIAEAQQYHRHEDTIARVRQLAVERGFVHLHYPQADGLKGDQLNYAAAQCMATLPNDTTPDDVFIVCYDADSRPLANSLDDFVTAIRALPDASVFHQSSRFELRTGGRYSRRGLLPCVARAICDGGALRANRFVLAFEIPRLRNRSTGNALKRKLCSYVYSHVTGHGLCVRLSLMRHLPFPAQSILEDMHYSFYLGSRNLSMIAVPSLDRAEVPSTVPAQVRQAARWFVGPARFRQYLKDPATQNGWRARFMAISAFGSSLEWLGCLVVPPLVVLIISLGNKFMQGAAICVVAVYLIQLWITDIVLGQHDGVCNRLVRLISCPLAAMLFGVGGFIGVARLIVGKSAGGKTERVEAHEP